MFYLLGQTSREENFSKVPLADAVFLFSVVLVMALYYSWDLNGRLSFPGKPIANAKFKEGFRCVEVTNGGGEIYINVYYHKWVCMF